MKKRSQFIKKSGLLMGAVLVCMSFPGRITWAEESNEITADQAEERKERILISYLLDTDDILPDSGSLRIRVINSYDDVLRQEDTEKQGLSDTMYAINDVNGDGMPELLIKSPNEGAYTYELYTYDQEADQVENISESGIAELDTEGKLDFRYAYPKKIWEDSADINADDEEEQVSVYSVNNEKGYACILIYVNGGKALAVQVKNVADKADIHIYPIKKQKALFYLRLYSDTEDEYCAFLQFSQNQLKEMVNMDGETKTAAVWPLAYGRADLDQDGEKELILRRYTADATEGGEYIYHVYHYDKDSKDYTEFPDAIFYSRAAGGQIFFEKETDRLLINETMGEPCYGVYTMNNGTLHREYEILDEIKNVPKIKFKRIEFKQEGTESTENPETTESQEMAGNQVTVETQEQSQNQQLSENTAAEEVTESQEASNNVGPTQPFEIHQSESATFQAPFYGIWCYGSKESADAYNYANSLNNAGFEAEVFLTTDWSNLNTESYYVVTAGTYGTEGEATANLAAVQSFCSDAYVKYSGNYQGQ